jgi:outer membrane protein OmpA-like peptidoglycan-associated protein
MYKLIRKGLFIAFICTQTHLQLQAQNIDNERIDSTYTPNFVLKTNLLYDATTTLNLGVEFKLSNKLTFDLPFNYNPWTFSDNRKLKHWLVQPELRYWVHHPFKGSFWGIHLHYAQFNVANLPFPQKLKDFQYEGWLAGAGLSYGYQWRLSDRWLLEATIGAGYAYIDYDKYECQSCGRKIDSGTKNYWGPTKAGLSLIYVIGKESTKKIIYPVENSAPVYFPPKEIPVQPETTYMHKSGEAFVIFPVDKYVVLPDLAQNRQELAKIVQSVDSVCAIPGVQLDKIVIEAYASPEGDLQHNITLSEERVSALKEYVIGTCQLDENLFRVRSKGENWSGLRAALKTAALTDKQKKDILKILDIDDLATRKALLKKYENGKPYEYLLTEIYPQLRISEYKIEYTVPAK